MRRFDAVVFDLFGTLVYEFRSADWDAWFDGASGALGVDRALFRREWQATSIERQTGRLGDMEQNVRTICERAGARPLPEQIAGALEVRMSLYRKCFAPTPGALDVLRWLRAEDYRTALISMCAPDTPPLWRASPFAGSVDVEVFSSEVGLRKPEPGIYLHACERLGVEPSACLYVGDGSFGELSGAAALGMHAVLVLDPGVDVRTIHRPEAEEWTGPRIGSLVEVRALLDGEDQPAGSGMAGPERWR
jgi:putative hydrolase of the HAD superfamily